MAGFGEIIGHEQTVTHLKRAIAADKVGHAYLFQGPDGSGKKLLAETFAKALLCEAEEKDTQPCGVCSACRRAAGHNHPDIIYVTHEKPALITVDEIRQQVVGDVAVKPYEGKYKVYIIEDAEKMNAAAQNTLLKTLEEPPAYAVILLLTVNAQALLETIRSRCILLDLKMVDSDLAEAFIMERMQIPDYQARFCVAFAQGSIGKAMELASSEYFTQIQKTALMVATKARDMDVSQLTQVIKDVSQYKVTIHDFLDILAVWYRDVLYFKATRDASRLVFRDQLQHIRTSAKLSSYEGIETILTALDTAGKRLDAYASFDLTMELLFLTIKEN